MALIPLPPNNNSTYVQQGNGQVYISWNLVPGATSYSLQRSIDGITYTTIATPTTNNYLDTTALLNVQYFYQVASVNGAGTSAYTAPQGIIPVGTGLMSLGGLRLAAQQRADRVASNFVTLPEWNVFINQAAFELYDLLIDVYEDYNVAAPAYFLTNGQDAQYPLPDGIQTFLNAQYQPYVAPPFYKLLGVDLGLNNAQNGFVTVKKFNFIDRNKYVFPNTASTIYGVFNMQYRLLANTIDFIPVPSASQPMRIWYIPRMPQLLQDTDVLDGVSGWTQYVIIRAAKYALDKEESDTTKLDAELLFLKQRIEESAMNRDAGQADTISDTRGSFGYGNNGNGWSGFPGGGW